MTTTQRGTFPTTIYINPNDVVVDDAYQRVLDPKRVARIAKNFDEKLFGIPFVSRRGGKFYAVDGQHRIAAAVLIGLTQIPVQIVDDLSTKDEAYVWGQVNNSRKLHTSVEAFQGAYIAGSEVHGEIVNILNSLGLTLNKQRGENNIGAAGMLMQVQKKGGVPLLRDTLVLIQTVWNHYPWSLDKRFIQGVGTFLHIYEHIINWDDLVEALLIAVSDNLTPHRILDKANDENPGVGAGNERSLGIAQVIKGAYNKYGHHKYGSVKRRPFNNKEYVGFVKISATAG